MSFDKVEVRVFSGPDQVQVGSNTKPDLIVMNIGPKGDTGPAGPNSVTSATTSDGTGQIMLDTLAVGICNILDEVVFDTLTYTFAEGSAQALKDAIQIASADITDASTVPVYNETTELYEEVAALYDGEGAINAVNFYSQGAFQSFDGDNYASFIVSNTPISWLFGTKQFSIKEPLGNGGQCTIPDASGTFALTSAANGEPDKLTAGTISGATTFNTTSYTYGIGAAAAHRTALGLTTLATTTPGTNVANFLEFPTSANLASALTDENGTGGGFVRAEGATLTTPTFTGSAARANGQNAVPATSDEVMTRGQSDSRIGKVAVMSADVTVVSSTTPVPLTVSSSNHPDGLSELGFTLAANKTYAFEFIGEFYEETSPKNQLFTLAGPSGSSFSCRIIAGASGSTAVYQIGGGSTVSNLISTGSYNGMIKIYGLIKMGATSGNVTLRFSQNSSTANPTTIKKGSTMILFGGA